MLFDALRNLAAACRNYAVESGANTWFMPAANEWARVTLSVATQMNAKSAYTEFNGFATGREFWTSTQETSTVNVYVQLFSNQTQSTQFTIDSVGNSERLCCVRAVSS